MAANDKQKYTVVKGTVKHNGKTYKPGDGLELTGEEAAKLKGHLSAPGK